MGVPIIRHPGPRHYIAAKVTHQSVKLCGRYVDLKALSKGTGLCHSYVTRIISGERHNPSSTYLRKIADALGMTTDALLDAIEERKSSRRQELRRRFEP